MSALMSNQLRMPSEMCIFLGPLPVKAACKLATMARLMRRLLPYDASGFPRVCAS